MCASDEADNPGVKKQRTALGQRQCVVTGHRQHCLLCVETIPGPFKLSIHSCPSRASTSRSVGLTGAVSHEFEEQGCVLEPYDNLEDARRSLAVYQECYNRICPD